MNVKILEMAQKANKSCVEPVGKIDPRFLNSFAEEVMKECLTQIEDNNIKTKIKEHIIGLVKE